MTRTRVRLGWASLASLLFPLGASVAVASSSDVGSVSSAPATPAATERRVAEPHAVFALIIGVNTSLEAPIAPLRYADDDAARYLDLFRALGARTYLLSRLDGNTRRLHPQAAAEALPPRRGELRQTVANLARDIEQARARGVRSTLYLVYAGHGDLQDASWSLTLEDGRLAGQELVGDVVERANADQSHVILDACHAYMLALPRGPGGTRRPATGFVALEAAARAGRIGFLLSSSTSGESHEWAGFEAGVFSHEVRSGLYGAADVDGDGRVTYGEIGAFVARANEAIKNDRFRPRLLAQPPNGSDLLLDLRGQTDRELRLDGKATGAHYLLENDDGVRLLDFHGTGREPIRLVRPVGEGTLFLRRVADGAEWTIPRADHAVEMTRLASAAPRAQTRGAASHAFAQIFSLSFDPQAVTAWTSKSQRERADLAAQNEAYDKEQRYARLRRGGAFASLGAGMAAGIGATIVGLSAHQLRAEAPAGESQRDTIARNESIAGRNLVAGLLGAAAVVGVSAGVLLLLWPRRPASPTLDLVVAPGRAGVSGLWRF